MQLTTKQQEQLDGWIDQARELEQSAFKWAEILWKIKESDYWKAKADSWVAFLQNNFGFSRRSAYEWTQLFGFTVEQRKLAETNSSIEVPKSLNQAKKLMLKTSARARTAEKVKPVKLEVMSAKLDTHGPDVQYAKPPAPPMDLRILMEAIDKDFDRLLHRQDIPFEALRLVHKLACEVKQARQLLQGVLPGMEEVVSRPKFKAPSLEEVQLFCEKSGICGTDAEWFWNKMVGAGWKNAGKPVVSWQGTLIAWKLANYLPSLKAKGSIPPQKTLASKEWDKMLKDSQRL